MIAKCNCSVPTLWGQRSPCSAPASGCRRSGLRKSGPASLPPVRRPEGLVQQKGGGGECLELLHDAFPMVDVCAYHTVFAFR